MPLCIKNIRLKGEKNWMEIEMKLEKNRNKKRYIKNYKHGNEYKYISFSLSLLLFLSLTPSRPPFLSHPHFNHLYLPLSLSPSLSFSHPPVLSHPHFKPLTLPLSLSPSLSFTHPLSLTLFSTLPLTCIRSSLTSL